MHSDFFKIAVIGTACVDQILDCGDFTSFAKRGADGSIRLGGKMTPTPLAYQAGGSAVNSHRALSAIGKVFGVNIDPVTCMRLGNNLENPGKSQTLQDLRDTGGTFEETTGDNPSYKVPINIVMVNGVNPTERMILRTGAHDIEQPPLYAATRLRQAVAQSNIVIVNSKPLPEAVIALDAAIEGGTKIILDYSPDLSDTRAMETLASYLPRASYAVLPSDTLLPGMTVRERGDIPTLKQRLIDMGCNHFLISDEARDVHVWNNGQDCNVTPPKLKAIDPNGAGDVRNAGLAVGLLMGKDFCQAAEMSCHIATLSAAAAGSEWIPRLEPFAREYGLI